MRFVVIDMYIHGQFTNVHYCDVIMGPIASQITSPTIFYSTVHSGADQRKHQSSASRAFVRELTGEFPVQLASYAENVSIWWCHHVLRVPRRHQLIHSSI